MNNYLVGRLALRYLRGKGTANAVPILSRISMVAIAVSSCAMIILFSVFNGFEGLVDGLYKAFYPDIKITATKGKFFVPEKQLLQKITQLDALEQHTMVLEDNVLINTEEGDYLPVSIKGVDKNYFDINDVAPYITKGNGSLIDAPIPTLIIGQHIAANLGVDVDNVFARIMVFYPNTKVDVGNVSPTDAFQSMIFKPDGVFMVQEEFNSKYILAPIGKVQELLGQAKAISSIDLKLKPNYSLEKAKKELQQNLGTAYTVNTRYEQNKAVYMVMHSEKWAGYAILLFVLLIASFNMVSALSLLVLEKQKDMGTLRTMGILPSQLSKVILLEGVLWSLVGGSAGLLLGLLLCWAQTQFKLIKIQGAFIIDAYPVAVQWTDVIVVLMTISVVGFVAAIYPARRVASQKLNEIMGGK
ncbi:MAG: FtsX-like permease family protein [Phycisphaerales bacterium]|nr:FtsX-like permease family protein [Phycisphaerales bacterium]